jgi:hypothetical protein
MSSFRKLLSFTGLCVLGISVAAAQEVPQSIVDCAALRKDSSRLACFDREVAELTHASQSVAPTQVTPAAPRPSAPFVAATPPQNASVKEDDFGVSGNLARKRSEEKKVVEAPLKELRAKVTNVTTKPYGELMLEFDNGQVWEQPEKKFAFLIKVGEGVVIKQHKLGSFFLTTDSGAVTRVRRVR